MRDANKGRERGRRAARAQTVGSNPHHFPVILLTPWRAVLNSLPRHTFRSPCSTRKVSRQAGRGMFASGAPSGIRISIRGRASTRKEAPFSAPSCLQKTKASIAKRGQEHFAERSEAPAAAQGFPGLPGFQSPLQGSSREQREQREQREERAERAESRLNGETGRRGGTRG